MGSFQKSSLELIEELKKLQHDKYRILVNNHEMCYLTPVGYDCCANAGLIDTFTHLRIESQHAFTKIFDVTNQGTRIWLNKGLLDRKDRLLFIVKSNHGDILGHIGVSSFDFENDTCEIDNVIKSSDVNKKALFYNVCKTLMDWIYESIKPKRINLRVLHDNTKAIALYHNLGFVPVSLIPLEKKESDHDVEWVDSCSHHIDRFFILMSDRKDK